jgi:RNA methyltransferase, TrmH family
MLSKNVSKYITALQIKKYRQENGAFLVEGAKSVIELLYSDFKIETIVTTPLFYEANTKILANQDFKIEYATADELSKVGSLQTNDSCIAIVKTKENSFVCASPQEFVLVLDDIRDPGNLGTIIRIADWYGIKKIICSETTTDWYNPKVISATKGSFTRVSGFYTDLKQYLSNITNTAVYGTFMSGQNVHEVTFGQSGYVVMGNESNGISAEVEAFVNQKITIPRFGQAESLNVGIASAIILDNLKRNT